MVTEFTLQYPWLQSISINSYRVGFAVSKVTELALQYPRLQSWFTVSIITELVYSIHNYRVSFSFTISKLDNSIHGYRGSFTISIITELALQYPRLQSWLTVSKVTELANSIQGYGVGLQYPLLQSWFCSIQGYRVGLQYPLLQSWICSIQGYRVGLQYPRLQSWLTVSMVTEIALQYPLLQSWLCSIQGYRVGFTVSIVTISFYSIHGYKVTKLNSIHGYRAGIAVYMVR